MQHPKRALPETAGGFGRDTRTHAKEVLYRRPVTVPGAPVAHRGDRAAFCAGESLERAGTSPLGREGLRVSAAVGGSYGLPE